MELIVKNDYKKRVFKNGIINKKKDSKKIVFWFKKTKNPPPKKKRNLSSICIYA